MANCQKKMWFTRALSDALRARCLRIYKGINQKLSILNKVGTLYQFNVQKINIAFVTEWTSITIKNKKNDLQRLRTKY